MFGEWNDYGRLLNGSRVSCHRAERTHFTQTATCNLTVGTLRSQQATCRPRRMVLVMVTRVPPRPQRLLCNVITIVETVPYTDMPSTHRTTSTIHRLPPEG